MKERLNKEILEEFYQISNFDIQTYFSNFSLFMKTDYNNLNNYFSGKTDVISPISFKKLNDLLDVNDELFSLFTQLKTRLTNYKWWELIDQAEDVWFALKTVENLSKWLRSPLTNNSYSRRSESKVVLKQTQNLEFLNKDILNNNDWQNSWTDTAIRNDLKEEDYTNEGGNILSVTYTQLGQIFLNSVVDHLQNEKILGLDLDKKITFEDDDLKVLTYSDTFKQSVLILSGLRRLDNPYYADDGIDPRDVIGTNINIINYPSIFRQMSLTFATDDTIKNFEITDIKRKSDAIYAEFKVISRLNDVQPFDIRLSN